MDSYLTKAKEILLLKNTGPSGVLAYTWANAHKVVDVQLEDGDSYSFNRPYIKQDSCLPLQTYFTIVETNRSGITVATPPGGTQDILFNVDGKKQYAELAKPDKQSEFLSKILGVDIEEIDDELFVAHLLSSDRITNLELESEFSAAVRETEEEHGWDFQMAKDKSKIILETDETFFSKRSFVTNPPTPSSQKVFVVEALDFDGVIPRRTDKVETKISSLLGNSFYEQGNFMNLKDLKNQLDVSKEAVGEDGNKSDIVLQDYKAAESRFNMIKRIATNLKLN